MQKHWPWWIVWLLLLTLAPQAQEASQKVFVNRYPIILVHGFIGWGSTELMGYKYWGGMALDIEKYLRKKNFEVYTATVGPISSNHDRACELFYQIKGGQVDYGVHHADQFKHARFGRVSAGLYQAWDRHRPVHLIGHSMGGQTCRMLVELLAQDHFGVGTDTNWVKSVTTISTPNNGTTLATLVDNFSGGQAEKLVGGFLALAGSSKDWYDFKMDQWHLKPRPDESMHEFLKRVDEVLGNTTDISLHDLLPRGAAEFNKRVQTFPKVYYLSYATEETYVMDKKTGFEWAEPTMNPMLWTFAYHMGRYQGPDVSPQQAWWQNDGMVNTISMSGPFNATIVPYKGELMPGVWNYMGLQDGKDHGKIIGHYQEPWRQSDWLKKFYSDLANILYQLR